VLVTHVWNFASLGAYKRILSLFSQSSAAISGDSSSDPDSDLVDLPDLQETYFALLATLTSQLCALPESAFDSELPDLDTFYLAQIGNLRANLGAALGAPKWWGSAGRLIAAWKNLQEAAMKRGWEVEDLRMGDEDSDDEEGEYAPVVVEM
jgi:A1 cistron-splicing factor AAR2